MGGKEGQGVGALKDALVAGWWGRLLSFGSQSSWREKLLLEPEPGWWSIYQAVIAMSHMSQRGAIFFTTSSAQAYAAIVWEQWKSPISVQNSPCHVIWAAVHRGVSHAFAATKSRRVPRRDWQTCLACRLAERVTCAECIKMTNEYIHLLAVRFGSR